MGEKEGHDLHVIKNIHGWLALILFIIYILLDYLLFYSKTLNSAAPTVYGLSKAFAYSIAVWIYGMIVILYAALKAWK
jgi:hypothetical protein